MNHVPLGVNISGTKLDLQLLKNFIQRRPAAMQEFQNPKTLLEITTAIMAPGHLKASAESSLTQFLMFPTPSHPRINQV